VFSWIFACAGIEESPSLAIFFLPHRQARGMRGDFPKYMFTLLHLRGVTSEKGTVRNLSKPFTILALPFYGKKEFDTFSL
jgi:hypothetical protein